MPGSVSLGESDPTAALWSGTVKPMNDLEDRFEHAWCLLCGSKNPLSLKLAFRAHDGGVTGRFQPRQHLQGYQGLLHGGVISALLDAAMTHCLFHHNVRAVTGELHVRFLQPVSCDDPFDMTARITAQKPPLFYMAAELANEHHVLARAEATFMQCAAHPPQCIGIPAHRRGHLS